jgi:hypothetical protein
MRPRAPMIPPITTMFMRTPDDSLGAVVESDGVVPVVSVFLVVPVVEVLLESVVELAADPSVALVVELLSVVGVVVVELLVVVELSVVVVELS